MFFYELIGEIVMLVVNETDLLLNQMDKQENLTRNPICDDWESTNESIILLW